MPELHGIVDDNEEEDAAPQQNHFFGLDLDELCAYKTIKSVRMRDTRLGLLYWSSVLIVLLYVVLYALGINRMHQYHDSGVGAVITSLKGKATFKGKAYDEADLAFHPASAHGTFLATRILTVRGQKVDHCIDYTQRCNCKDGPDCSVGVGGHFCKRLAWCPSLGDGNTGTSPPPPSSAEVITLEGLGRVELDIVSGISFPGIGSQFFVTGGSKGSVNPFKNETIESLLQRVQPPVKLEDVVSGGALIGVSFLWNCDVVEDCEPAVAVRRLDQTGFSEPRSWQYAGKDGGLLRDTVVAFGIRILVDSSGTGRRTSPTLVLVQLGSGLALLQLAAWFTDFAMLHLFSATLRHRYVEFKIIETRDYSDLRDRLDLLQQDEQSEARGLLGSWTGDAKDGDEDMDLGPTAGGHGGLGNAVLRGGLS